MTHETGVVQSDYKTLGILQLIDGGRNLHFTCLTL